MIEQIKQALEKVTRGDDWTNMTDAGVETKYVAEYNRLTENMRGLIATCETVDAAQLIANAPEWMRYLLGEVERLKEREFNHYPITILALESRIDGLQKALEWYADEQNYKDVYQPEGFHKFINQAESDAGQRARIALQSIQGGDNT